MLGAFEVSNSPTNGRVAVDAGGRLRFRAAYLVAVQLATNESRRMSISVAILSLDGVKNGAALELPSLVRD
jgi:hypothetical protein